MADITEDRFTAMGTTVHIQVVGGDPSVALEARRRLLALEDLWSRFRPGSDVSELNRCAGTAVSVAWETLLLLQRAVDAAEATHGRFDPTVGAALVAHGYDRTFAEVPSRSHAVTPAPMVDGSWPAIEVDVSRGTACIPLGTRFDGGGLGKGLAADLIVDELAGQSDGLLINIGGDMRLRGAAADPAGWVITVDDPFDDRHELLRLAVPSGAVATSSKRVRRWETAEGPAHHIIDPSTGRPAEGDVAAVTVIAAEAWWAEVQATSLFLQGPRGVEGIDRTVEALMVMDDGSTRATPGLAAVLP